MNFLNIKSTILYTFKKALITTKYDIDLLLNKQHELGKRKKSENWLIFLSNYLNDAHDLNTQIKDNGTGYKYLELRLESDNYDTAVICHLQYLKKRTWFPRSAAYRDIQRKKNPSLQKEFSDSSFYNSTKKEVYYLFCFGEDVDGLFGIFSQPDGLCPCYYAQSQNCIEINENEDIGLREMPDTSVFDIKEEIIENLIGKEA